MLTDDDRKYVLHEFLRNISGIADINYQKRVWIRGEGPECDDFGETVCHFFDDGDPIIEKYKDYGISGYQHRLLVQFHKTFEAFSDSDDRPYLPEDFIETPEWTKIRVLAKEVLIAFGLPYEKKLQGPQNWITK